MDLLTQTIPRWTDLTDFVDFIRLESARHLDPTRRARLGQYFTPAPVGRAMARMSRRRGSKLRILDAGAGVGVLSASLLAQICSEAHRPQLIELVAVEIDSEVVLDLRNVLETCREACQAAGIVLEYCIREEDFITASAESLSGGLFSKPPEMFDIAILNPPYKKIRSDSHEREILREIGIETTNLYTGFVALAFRQVVNGGELIAITPRSFCNGPYFTPFRKELLAGNNLSLLHVFDSRDVTFGTDDVLQENIIFRVERGTSQNIDVCVEWSEGGSIEHVSRRQVPFTHVVHSDDPDAFIHIAPDEWDSRIATLVEGFPATLDVLGLQVSTGRVVDFRAKKDLRQDPEAGTVPLIYPMHLCGGLVAWPKAGGKKPNAIVANARTESLFNPNGNYVLVKRFSSKEEPRRIVAALATPSSIPGERIALENHLNYYHCNGSGLPKALATGITAYLNSTIVDAYFRQFNGHTQVNATDLRKLRYPSMAQIERIALRFHGKVEMQQHDIDAIVEEELLGMSDSETERPSQRARVDEALDVLGTLGLPREQQNERSALTLLALLGLRPDQPWSDASASLCRVTPIMEFVAEHYGKQWAPNTRETVRRFTLHQFKDAGLVVTNPDKPSRPVNSPAYCYQVPNGVLDVLRAYGTSEWQATVDSYLARSTTLAKQYASAREMARIPLTLKEGVTVTLSPGGQNELIKAIVEEFCERFTPGAATLYIGDADAKWGYFDADALRDLGVDVDSHGKMPDVVVYFAEKNWLVVIEAVTSHGPVNPKRRGELKSLFANSSAPLVYVTAFLDKATLARYVSDIAWETEVWVADAPGHMVHFNGERFLGPYEE